MVTRVRHARPDDAGIVAAVAAETFELACPPGTGREAIAAFIAEHLSEGRFRAHLGDPSRIVLLADVDNEIAGYTMLVAGEPADPDVAAVVAARPAVELSKCYVRAAFHGQGVSKALMQSSIDSARELGGAALWLGVNQHNERAQRFYRASGFERVGTKHFLVGDELHDDYVFERSV
ncbi:GNAT family N-acetyltransferase [Herbiconiux moechotypicola]|uniref:GNAT family N-acetyltransferase n=1 Tax=Herbiconiux moechotypicola TaxID=637393 RepID=A0ABN3DS15_9MICO|nr:GNAT family N-acetyltransferase [Herbiconiux moechotypicola]MCS5731735.1 GNAT family N-acetyltransferase [Herbiconiux moechotypicola]